MILLGFTNNLWSTTVTVCPDCEISQLVQALSTVVNCDTIIIEGGTYEVENISIDKSVAIIGKNGPKFISKSGDEIFTITAPHVTIKNLSFYNVTTSYIKERSAIRIVKQKYFNIDGNFFKDCFFGVYLEHTKEGIVSNNVFEGNATTEAASGNGIHAWYCQNLLVENNRITGHRDGIYFEFVNLSHVNNNHSELNKRYGLHFMFSNDDSYSGNSFINNGVGVAVMFSRRIIMKENTFAMNWGRASYGLLLKEIYDAELTYNTFNQNTIGIFVEGSNRVNYVNNDFERNGWAIKFSGGCEDNQITKNNFVHNSLDLIVNTKLSSNRFHHNYWSSYAGYDLDHDNIGDIPHYPVKLFSYILDQAPEAIVLMRSMFVDLINFSERVSPVFTPKEVMDEYPLIFKN